MSSVKSDALEPLTVTVEQARKITNLGVTTLYAKMKAGELASTTVGGRRLIYYSAIKKLLGLAA